MQIRTLSPSIKIKTEELDRLLEQYRPFLGTYPPPTVIIAHTLEDVRLAYFDSSSYCIVFQEDFIMNADEHSQKNVALHELAHAMQFIFDGDADHGAGFQEYCRKLGCDPEFSRAKVNATKEKRESYARKVEKLLALSSSPYEEESKAALLKAEELMAAHGLEYSFQSRNEDRLYAATLGRQGRFPLSAKKLFQLVSNLTGGFLLYELADSRGERQACIYGSLDQVETAVYLNSYFTSALDRCVKAERKERRKSGLGFSAESYKLGLITGLINRMSKENAEASRALALCSDRNMEIYQEITNARFRTTRTRMNPNSMLDYGSGLAESDNIGIPRSDERIKGRKLIES